MATKLNENTKVTMTIGQITKLVRESLVEEARTGIKDFDEVVPGDIGTDYNGIPCVIISKATASTIEDPTGTFEYGQGAGDIDPDQPSVLVQFFTGEKAAYIYDDSGVTVRYENGNVKNVNRNLVKEEDCCETGDFDDEMLEETAEDDWLDGWLKDHPEDLQKTLDWINRTKPTMSQAGKDAWARNILKKRHREGKIDPEHPTAVETPSATSSTFSKEPRTASPEDEERFVKEITGYGKYADGKDKTDPNERWLSLDNKKWTKRQVYNRNIPDRWYKPVGFTEDGKIMFDLYPMKYTKESRDSDGDYDDGKLHSWTDYWALFTVDPTDKVGEAIGELKNGVVVLPNGKELHPCSPRWTFSWREKDRWSPAHRDYYSTGGTKYYSSGRRWGHY